MLSSMKKPKSTMKMKPRTKRKQPKKTKASSSTTSPGTWNKRDWMMIGDIDNSTDSARLNHKKISREKPRATFASMVIEKLHEPWARLVSFPKDYFCQVSMTLVSGA